MSIETMMQRVFPCEDATDEEISRAFFGTSYGSSDDAEKLQKMACRVSGAAIPWDTAEHLAILGQIALRVFRPDSYSQRCSLRRASLPSPHLLMADAGVCAASPLEDTVGLAICEF